MVEVAGAVLLGIGVLVPSVARLIESVAYWNRARGQSAIIRARRRIGSDEVERQQERRTDG